MTSSPLALEVKHLQAWYGESHVLHGIDIEVRQGECVSLLGRNGAGRTSTLRAILGLTSQRSGEVRIHGRDVMSLPTHQIARLGVGYCPEERAIYASLSCEENLLLPPVLKPGGMSLDEIYDLFPNLKERRKSQGTRLSGGEQQMLAMARILRTGADILFLDEISEGLAPVIVEKLGQVIEALKQRGYTIVLVEQNFEFAADLADRLYVIEHGEVVSHLPAAEIASQQAALKELLGI
ncbi:MULTISPECIES: ABC transporter ATP-binding protein [Hydrogenophaga]|uniref:ABC transporter ATP-binding protein n=1 Tax=Hydrogenophaga electricum TaxID=1230953 RepID=A0ABQ6CCS4_9BURK|nr:MULTISPECIES: ABC transporter ATP-binding protein [Hydrogenophaga]GLS16469.1 ABC transporter ATP-binding protein [Hydrogenophaga electricum]